MSQISLYLFGPPRVEYAARPVTMRLQKEMALLVYLAESSRAHTRMALATLFWPELDQSGALAALRRTLYQLKSDVGENLLDSTPSTVSLRHDVAVRRDTQHFLDVARQCINHDHPPDAPLASCLTAMREAVTFYTDDFLAGFSLPDCPMFDEWQFFAREELRAEYLRILALLTSSYERLGDWERGVEMARLWLSREPDHEPAHRALIRLYAMGGQYAAARRQYKICRRMLAEHLGVEPDEETVQLYRAIEASSFH
ncbi:MAG TPA: BTAD domain-containing putative transcriptional regulator, partial [Ktedonobacterales bacterium]|nr:BTAD domain-containing putative transcriptional regulator [Ktedonobacterales bacterium]